MKKEILAYINGVINSYSNTITALETNGAFSTTMNTLTAIKEEFTDLLEFVIDIPEENKEASILNFNLALEDHKIKGCNAMLEKVCDNFKNENCKLVQEKENLRKQIETYKLSELIWKNIYKEQFKN